MSGRRSTASLSSISAYPDSGLPCPMAYRVPVCTCGGIPLRTTVREDGTRYFLRHGAGQRGCRVFGDLAKWA